MVGAVTLYGVQAAVQNHLPRRRTDGTGSGAAQIAAAVQVHAAALPAGVNGAACAAVAAGGSLYHAFAMYCQGRTVGQLYRAFQAVAVQVQGGGLAGGDHTVYAMAVGVGKGGVGLQGDILPRRQPCGDLGPALRLRQGKGIAVPGPGLFAAVGPEQPYRLHRLREDQQGKGQKDTQQIPGRRFQKVKEQSHLRQMPGIPANHIAVRHNGFIVGVGGRAVGGKPRRAVGSGGQGAYLVGDGIAVVAVVAAGKSNDIPRLQGAGVHMAHKNQIARAEIRCRH